VALLYAQAQTRDLYIKWAGILILSYHTIEHSNSSALHAAHSLSYELENEVYSATTATCTKQTIQSTNMAPGIIHPTRADKQCIHCTIVGTESHTLAIVSMLGE
jgi:hypothetical protein